MSLHEQFAEDLALYALNCLSGEEKASLERHLADCSACCRELEQLRGDAALLALSTVGPAPPARAKTHLMNAIAQEAQPRRQAKASVPGWQGFPWLAAAGWVTAAVLFATLTVLWKHNERLRSNAVELTRNSEQQKLKLEEAARVAQVLTAGDAMHVTVLPVNYKTPPPEGRAIYSRERAGLVFVASNLHSLPAQKAYELWLIPMHGAPIPAGMFKPDARGGAMVLNPPLPAGVEAKAFAVTIEPEAGSQTPTMPIVMMGAGS